LSAVAQANKPTSIRFAQAFFEKSDLEGARREAKLALRKNPRNVEALFVEMEAAALEADTPAVLDAALHLLEIRPAQNDDRVAIAAARIHDLAANTQEFRAILSRLEAVLARPHAQAYRLRAALLKAAMDGLPGVNVPQVARDAGILTDWRAVGPFGEHPNLDFPRAWPPQQDELRGDTSGGHRIELFRFDDGNFRLPEYFGKTGVFYAMAEANFAAGETVVRVETPGTLEVFVDGASVLRQDSRFNVTPATATQTVRLKPGTHKVLVKFLAKALPFRVSLEHEGISPTSAKRRQMWGTMSEAEAQYVSAARKYWDGDFDGAIAGLQQLRTAQPSAASGWMLYLAWTQSEEHWPAAASALDEIVKQSPEALAAEYEIAARANAADRTDDALEHLERVLARCEHFVPAQDLMGKIAIRIHWAVRATRALEVLVDIHPSCDVLRRAQHFFAGYAHYDRTRKIDQDLAQCAIDSIAYANSLSEEGRHAEAAVAAQKEVAQHPLDRSARELLGRELALAGKEAEARTAIQQLAELAPNSERYRRMALTARNDVMAVLDEPDANTHAFDAETFYAPYRRDGMEMVKQTANRRFLGGSAVRILDDQVTRLWPDGRVSVYVHRITRVLDRGGVEKYGEVEVPRGAEILELRTIRKDDTTAEPEMTSAKMTISMPGLLPGDAMDVEYVVHHGDGDGIEAHAEEFAHTFGSFRAPILSSRLVVLTPTSEHQTIVASPAAPGINESETDGTHVRIWEKKDIAQSVEEVASAKSDALPTVRVLPTLERGWEAVRDSVRETAVDAGRVGPRVKAAVGEIRTESDDVVARELYRTVTTTLRSTTPSFGDDVPPAEETFANGEGSRTAALLALSRARGLQADLVLARNKGTAAPVTPAANVYTRPLVRFRLRDPQRGTHDVVVDADTDGLPFGTLAPNIAHSDSLLVTLPAEKHNASVETAILQLAANHAIDESIARAEIKLEANGDLRADVTILLGAWRGAQMRAILARIEKKQRGHFYQQLVARIFPGAENVTGEVKNEESPEKSLELVLHCSSPKFVNLARGTAELEQLVPTLGLKKMYAGNGARQSALYVDTPLFETATFHIHLPEGVTVARPAKDVAVENEFGKYSVTFREPEAGVLEVRRAFDIPVQVVPANKFAAFAHFAAQIDEAERQKIGLKTERMMASAGGK
jgi:tetratricopeptide (TPR) repeat protein